MGQRLEAYRLCCRFRNSQMPLFDDDRLRVVVVAKILARSNVYVHGGVVWMHICDSSLYQLVTMRASWSQLTDSQESVVGACNRKYSNPAHPSLSRYILEHLSKPKLEVRRRSCPGFEGITGQTLYPSCNSGQRHINVKGFGTNRSHHRALPLVSSVLG